MGFIIMVSNPLIIKERPPGEAQRRKGGYLVSKPSHTEFSSVIKPSGRKVGDAQQSWQTFCKGQIVKLFTFELHTVSVCHCSVKATTDNRKMRGHGQM